MELRGFQHINSYNNQINRNIKLFYDYYLIIIVYVGQEPLDMAGIINLFRGAVSHKVWPKLCSTQLIIGISQVTGQCLDNKGH